MLRWVLTLSSIYSAIIGLALVFAPMHFGVGAVPPDASPKLLALMRLLGGPFLGAVAANDVHGVFSGEAREIARVFLLIHIAFTAAFLVAWTRRRA